MINDPLYMWKENQSITLFRCYFRISKGHYHILVGDHDDDHGKVTREK